MIGSIETGLNEISEYCEQRDATAECRGQGGEFKMIKCEKSQVQLLSRGVPATQLARSN